MNTAGAPPRLFDARVPGSKSLTDRARLLATAADATSVLTTPLVSEYTVAFRDALVRLGSRVDTAPGGRLPLRMRAQGLGGCSLEVDGGLSSRFLSGLLMAGPLLRTPLLVRVRELVSRPYIDMAVALMRHFGAEMAPGEFSVRPTGYRAADLRIEPDASTASYLLAAAAVTGRGVTVDGLGRGSLQGDMRFVDVLERAGARVRRGREAVTVIGTCARRACAPRPGGTGSPCTRAAPLRRVSPATATTGSRWLSPC